MIKETPLLLAAFLLASSLFQTGCSNNPNPGMDAKTDMALIKSKLKKAQRSKNPLAQIYFLRTAYDLAIPLATQWPEAEKVPAFLAKHDVALQQIPQTVYTLAMQTKDFESFNWAISRAAPIDIQHAELLKFWELGKEWRDFILERYLAEALPIFMDRAIEGYDVRFFAQYAGDFKALGFKVVFPLEKTEFNARLCRFISDMIDRAMQKNDPKKIGFLLDHTPPLPSVIYIDKKTERTMQTLGDYLFHELRDEALACKLLALGYDLNRTDISTLDFGADFAKTLAADPEYALMHVLKLNEWHGVLSEAELRFLLPLPDPLLQWIHPLHIDEALESTIKSSNSKVALRLIHLREKTRPLTPHDYDQLLGWSIESKNSTIFNYVKSNHGGVDLFKLDLVQLAENKNLFRLYAPKILKRIYKTMDKKPKSDGTTFGRIHDLLLSHHPEAVLFLVTNYDFGDAWTEVTEGRTVLMDVCEGGNLAAARYLIEEKGANVHAQTGYIELQTSVFGRTKSKEGRLTPLFFAAKSGHSDLINYLISKQAIVNVRSAYGATPLMYAVDHEHLEAVQALLAAGAQVNAAMNTNLTATELVEIGRYEEILNAYRRAKKTGNQEILNVLKKAGARP